MPRQFVPALIVTLLLAATGSRADWRTDSGWFILSSELGAAMPAGAEIEVLHCEADADGTAGAPYVYLPLATAATPFAGTGAYSGKTFNALTGPGPLSHHADSVGSIFYGPAGLSNGVTTIHCHEANNYFDELTGASTPPVWSGTVQNFSWIGTTGVMSADADALRRFDFALDRDGRLAVVGMNNDTGPVPALMACSWHAISAGLLSGTHGRNGTVIDVAGRMKPDLVVHEGLTSYAAPAIASAAALLYDTIRPGFPDADHPQVVKALLLAAASKKNLPAWQRDASTEPYDDVFGAGELNILHAHHMLVRGRQPDSTSSEVAALGWDFTAASSSIPRRYFFTVPAGTMADTFSAVLTWHRVITTSEPPLNLEYNSSAPNLTLKLHASAAFAPDGPPIDQSDSTLDNVEHIWLRNLPSGQYMLEVSSDTNDHNYALAWEARIGSGPSLSPRRDAGGNVLIDFSGLDPFVNYTVEASQTLEPASWTSVGSFRTADTTPSTSHAWMDAGTPYPGARFYRLKWTGVR